MSFFRWGRKPSVAQQRAKAEKLLAKSGKGSGLSPVVIEGNKIATSFWGKAWCDNLERYSDYANRLPRGRSYVRNRCVIDLQIASGTITAQVSGSSLYRISIKVAPLDDKVWRAICRDCSGSIDSMVELLQGRLSKAVMDRVCRTGDGLFPAPKSIELSCSCPDGAYMCKHVAATLVLVIPPAYALSGLRWKAKAPFGLLLLFTQIMPAGSVQLPSVTWVTWLVRSTPPTRISTISEKPQGRGWRARNSCQSLPAARRNEDSLFAKAFRYRCSCRSLAVDLVRLRQTIVSWPRMECWVSS